VKDAPPQEKIDAARTVRSVLGSEAHVHGLGYGVTDKFAAAVQDDPALLDSIDYSTPISNSCTSDTDNGDERLSVVATRASAALVEDIRKLAGFPDEDSDQKQTVLNNF